MNAAPVQAAASEAALLTTPPPAKPQTPAEAAKQFEALLIAQMLRTARESMADDGADSTSETMFDVAGQQFAQMLAERGGFGLSKVIEGGLG
ncbi:MAG TPA: hypothetical protein VH639_12050 [Bryobacteraceae bacterium]|jgi:Rod binding domain-containing protein